MLREKSARKASPLGERINCEFANANFGVINKVKRSLIQILPKTQNSLLWELATESGRIYSSALEAYEKLGVKDAVHRFPKREFLHSQSYQGSYESALIARKSFFRALKDFGKHPSKYTGKPKAPKAKFLAPIVFKRSAIRIKNGYLLLSTARKDNPVKLRWSIEKPVWCTISMKNGEWRLTAIFEREPKPEKLGTKILAVDLGIKRVATAFDGEKTVLFSGKPLLAVNRQINRKLGSLAKLKGNESRRAKRKKFAIRKAIRKAHNRKADILHKYSRSLVNLARVGNCGTIIFGNCASIHDTPNTGKINNQKISGSCEQRFRKLVEYKFQDIGGATKVVSEAYTSQTCPVCGLRHKPKNRTFACSCGFSYDRDGVGAINIHVSFLKGGGNAEDKERICSLTEPIGVKYRPTLLCKRFTN